MDDGIDFLKTLQVQVGEWSQRNFGNQSPHRPCMGVVEELCELEEAFEDLDPAKAIDAMGDIAIYMADYFYRRGWDLSEAWKNRHLTIPITGSVAHLIGKLCHSHLKGEQGIRGGAEKQAILSQEACSGILGYIEHVGTFMDRDVIGVIQGTWEVVSKRDWKKNPNNAHEVAVQVPVLVEDRDYGTQDGKL